MKSPIIGDAAYPAIRKTSPSSEALFGKAGSRPTPVYPRPVLAIWQLTRDSLGERFR